MMERKVEDSGRARVDHSVLRRVAVPAGDVHWVQTGSRGEPVAVRATTT
jgi:hypothetical protein